MRSVLCAALIILCGSTAVVHALGSSGKSTPSPYDRGVSAGKAEARKATTEARKEYLRSYGEGLLAGLGEDRGGGSSYKLGGESVSSGALSKLKSSNTGFAAGVDRAANAESNSDRRYLRGYSDGLYEILGRSRTLTKPGGG